MLAHGAPRCAKRQPNLFIKCQVCHCTAPPLPSTRAAAAGTLGERGSGAVGTSLLITCEMSAAGAELCIHTSRPSRGVRQVQGQHRWVREAGWAQSPSSYPPNWGTGCLVSRVGPQAANKAGDMQQAAEPGGCQAPCRARRWKAILPLGTTLGTGGAVRCGAVMDGAMRHGWEAGAGLEPR